MLGLLFVVAACFPATAVAACSVRRFSPAASDSGIPHVEVILDGEFHPSSFVMIPVNFFGGCLPLAQDLP
jgi:CIC family chloride channel protein